MRQCRRRAPLGESLAHARAFADDPYTTRRSTSTVTSGSCSVDSSRSAARDRGHSSLAISTQSAAVFARRKAEAKPWPGGGRTSVPFGQVRRMLARGTGVEPCGLVGRFHESVRSFVDARTCHVELACHDGRVLTKRVDYGAHLRELRPRSAPPPRATPTTAACDRRRDARTPPRLDRRASGRQVARAATAPAHRRAIGIARAARTPSSRTLCRSDLSAIAGRSITRTELSPRIPNTWGRPTSASRRAACCPDAGRLGP